MFSPTTKILIADDMAMFRVMVKNALNDLGLRNHSEAVDGAQAWSLITDGFVKKAPFQLIISDWTMPNMTGLELLKKVRAEPWGKGFPFMMLTGETEKEMILAAIEAKVSQYIVKPFQVAGLKEKLNAMHNKWLAETGGKAVVAA